ncbi:hypothetical protein N798_00250 [Knoellia flava TL1]|uniref:Uncharacterized protein n=2 Tax=Knoellia flava TaxID=913969 RepID=A0A8H9KRG5_9MICO|nr:hypothetical protein [Knoellia flava]KGN36014.1 hypothetical protein N798_00250 [Knoellia flava TL1]GGB81377.1 hypothetical protein GCM10011314_21230 [Knoellia flava]
MHSTVIHNLFRLWPHFGPLSAYVCRGCGTEIVNKNAYRKCPVCGIKYD